MNDILIYVYIKQCISTRHLLNANNYRASHARKYYINQRNTLYRLQEHARNVTFMETNDFLSTG